MFFSLKMDSKQVQSTLEANLTMLWIFETTNHKSFLNNINNFFTLIIYINFYDANCLYYKISNYAHHLLEILVSVSSSSFEEIYREVLASFFLLEINYLLRFLNLERPFTFSSFFFLIIRSTINNIVFNLFLLYSSFS